MRRDRYLQDVAADERRRVTDLAVGPALHRTTIHHKRLCHSGRGVYRGTRESGAFSTDVAKLKMVFSERHLLTKGRVSSHPLTDGPFCLSVCLSVCLCRECAK